VSKVKRSSLTIEHALLGFLRRQPLHGYAIFQELTDPAGLGPVWKMKLSQLYALLSKLEDAGYVSAQIEQQEKKPPRKLFSLTPEGETAFLVWVQRPVQHGRALRLEFLVKVYFARREGPERAARLLAAQRELCDEWLARERDIVDAARSNHQHYGRLVHEFRVGQIQSMLHWLDSCEEGMQV
jgi:DNA-binding PadR family transcriptional regulator